jgi:DNA-binding XRE family transcriptional regulator
MAKPDYGAGALRALICAKPPLVEPIVLVRVPTARQIKATRKLAGLTQSAAGRLVHASLRTWQDWESGKRRMSLAAWELFNLLIQFESVRHARRQWYESLSAAA